MCGIVGFIGTNKTAKSKIIKGLENLDYRGYDSSGIALYKDEINIIKSVGDVSELKKKLTDIDDSFNLGIGHTRWATHGKKNETNAHPHKVGKITIVHNGIIENSSLLKTQLEEFGLVPQSETDTEIACALLNHYYVKTGSMDEAIKLFFENAKGSYALGIICDDYKDKLFAVKKDSPLIIALNNDENYIASDVPSILEFTNKYILLENYEYAILTNNNVIVKDKFGNSVKKETKEYLGDKHLFDKDGYSHYMLKEIHEQPVTNINTINQFLNEDDILTKIPNFDKYNDMTIIACGSAYHAGLIGKNLIEKFANIPVNVEIASEFRTKPLFVNEQSLVIVISQSGETADSLAALELAKEKGADTLGIINVFESSIARSSDLVLYTKAGTEVAVATTKAYSAQVALLSLITLKIAYSKNLTNKSEILNILEDVKKLPNIINETISNDQYFDIAKSIHNHESVFFLGRGIDYALALEGSLKLKEISYIHSEAYPAGELKHGTMSLIDEGTPVISIITDDNIKDKTISNIKEVKTRGANVTLITNEEIRENDLYHNLIKVKQIHPLLQPLVSIIPLQMIAYYTALEKDCSIDKPKNLAKSVTVE